MLRLPISPAARTFLVSCWLVLLGWSAASGAEPQRLLYVAVPGVRNYLEHGGHGILVFDIDRGHRFLKRIPAAGLAEDGKPSNVKGICANAKTDRLYISVLQKLACYDLRTDKLLWERAYEGGCDRMSITPDGRTLYLPSLEKSHWFALDALTGDVLAKLDGNVAAHNTIISLDGRRAYFGDRRDPIMAVADTRTHREIARIGPFGNVVRPFTIDRAQRRVFVCMDDLLGFEVADIGSGKVLHRVEVAGFPKGPVKRHACPSHGIGLTPDEKELWLTDAANERLHLYDNTVSPPRLLESIKLRDQPGWITFTIQGDLAYPSTGDVIDVKTRRIVAQLTDEVGAAVQSEKMIEIDFRDSQPVRVGDQFGLGRK